MVRTTVKIDGMSCGMCEAHIADVIRRTIPEAKRIRVSHTRNTAAFLTEQEVDAQKLEQAIDETGYYFRGISSELEKERKRLFRS